MRALRFALPVVLALAVVSGGVTYGLFTDTEQVSGTISIDTSHTTDGGHGWAVRTAAVTSDAASSENDTTTPGNDTPPANGTDTPLNPANDTVSNETTAPGNDTRTDGTATANGTGAPSADHETVGNESAGSGNETVTNGTATAPPANETAGGTADADSAVVNETTVNESSVSVNETAVGTSADETPPDDGAADETARERVGYVAVSASVSASSGVVVRE
ncbi:SipW-dependent-type signal peptide-containing protein [Salarchaeum japonicum]|uniref:SipW-dependent-type signal peptide-containing protein n=1 Tax=Salarchaeum japonicum TaxID=555573 RepID=UPI003C7391A8